MIPATSLENATKHNQASANKSCTLKARFRIAFLHFMAIRVRLRNIKRQRRVAINFNLNFLSHSDPQPNEHPAKTQSSFRIAFLHFLAIRARLRRIKRQGREGAYSQRTSRKPLRHKTQQETNQSQSDLGITFLHFLATQARLRKNTRQGREAPYLQTKSLKPLRPTTQRAPSQNTIRLPHYVLALSGHSGAPKKNQAARSRGRRLST